MCTYYRLFLFSNVAGNSSIFPLTCLSLRMKSESRNQKRVATTQVQVSMGISRNEASEAPARRHTRGRTQTIKLAVRHFNVLMKLKKKKLTGSECNFYIQIPIALVQFSKRHRKNNPPLCSCFRHHLINPPVSFLLASFLGRVRNIHFATTQW